MEKCERNKSAALNKRIYLLVAELDEIPNI